jgi:serine protease Do
MGLLSAAAQPASLPAQMVDRVASACVLIQVSKDKAGSVGSGFFVSRTDVVTNAHVVKPALEGEAEIVLVVGGDTKEPKLVAASLLAVDEDLDLALLRAEQKGPNVLAFESERRLRVTEPVWVVGFPFGAQPGLEATVTAGTISALRHDEQGKLRQVQIDAAVNRGNSGGPVVNALGKVVGVTQATVNPAVGSGMAIAVPSGATESFVAEAQKKRQRTALLSVRGRVRQRGVRLVRAEKSEEAWGIAVRFVVRGSRDVERAEPIPVEFVNRKREVVHRDALDLGDLGSREEKTVEIRLRGVAFEDVAACHLTE